MVLDRKTTTIHEFAENVHRSLAEPLQARRDLGRSGHLIVAGGNVHFGLEGALCVELVVVSNRGICRIYCDAHGRHDLARIGAAAA